MKKTLSIFLILFWSTNKSGTKKSAKNFLKTILTSTKLQLGGLILYIQNIYLAWKISGFKLVWFGVEV